MYPTGQPQQPPEPKKEAEEDDREFYLLEGRTPVRCYDERDGDFFIPIYEKIGNENGYQVG